MLIAALAVLASSPSSATTQPKAAVGAFASAVYAITFTAPARTTYCPVPANWEGSDHGTIIFLEPPSTCEGVGFPSSSRGFEPNVPRFEVEYGYDLDDDEDSPGSVFRCNHAGSLELLGAPRALCRTPDRQRVVLWSRANYPADAPAEVVLTLVTTPRWLEKDLSRFRRFAATVHTCRQSWTDAKGKAFSMGVGPQCPKRDWY